MKNNHMILLVVIALVVGGAGFFAGMKYQQSKQPTFAGRFAGQNGQQFRTGGSQGSGGAKQGFNAVIGEILSIDETSVTVKLPDGSSKIALLSEKTVVTKSATGVKDDLKVGERVSVMGSQNTDGSMTADSVQLNPMFGRMATPSGNTQN